MDKDKDVILSVIIPAYKKINYLPLIIIDVDYLLSKKNFNYEIVVVNNNPTNYVGLMVDRFKPIIKNLRLVNSTLKGSILDARGQWHLVINDNNIESINDFQPKSFVRSWSFQDKFLLESKFRWH